MFIYKITNNVNNKAYIGQTISPIAKRWSQHRHNSTRRNAPLYHAMQKYGLENFTFECIEKLPDGSTLKDLNNREVYWIQKLNTLCPNGYNIKIGGDSSGPLSKETKAKISAAEIGKLVSKESKFRMSLAQKGKKLPQETKLKISTSLKGNTRAKGNKLSEEHKAKIGAASKGKHRSEETKTKIRATKHANKLAKVKKDNTDAN